MSSAFERFATLDAAKFVDPSLMGIAAVYTRAGYNTPISINVNFLAPETVDPVGAPEIIQDQPACIIVETDAPNAGHGDKLVIAGVTYYIQSSHRDGAGHWMAVLTDSIEVPLPPFLLATTYPGTGFSVPLSWSLPTDLTRTGLELWRVGLDIVTNPLQRVTTLSAAAVSYTDTVTNNDTYTYTVYGTNAAGPGPPSNSLAVPVPTPP